MKWLESYEKGFRKKCQSKRPFIKIKETKSKDINQVQNSQGPQIKDVETSDPETEDQETQIQETSHLEARYPETRD